MEDGRSQQVARDPAACCDDVEEADPGGPQVGRGGGGQDGVEGEHGGGETPRQGVDGGEEEPPSWPVLRVLDIGCQCSHKILNYISHHQWWFTISPTILTLK